MGLDKVLLCVTVMVMLAFTGVAEGHGGMTEPPMRSVAWKYGFDTPVNYDWMSLYCGGLNVFTQNNGKCGLCGDAYSGPFDNDKGGMFDTGIIVRHYPIGLREIEVKVELTAHHKGHFQFRLCPNNAEELTQACFDRYPLMIREGRAQGDPTRYFPPKEPKLNELHVRLPEGLICDRCVLQWTYTAGNNIGRDVQETFVNCADISINGSVDRVPVANKQPIEGDVVVIEKIPNITSIIDRARPGSVSQVLSALAGSSHRPGSVLPVNTGVTSGEGRGVMNGDFMTPFGDRFQPDLTARINNNRDPRMFIPALNELDRNPTSRSPSNLDTPDHVTERGNMEHFPRFSHMNNMRHMTSGGWMPRQNMFDQGSFRSSVHGGPPQWGNSPLDRSFPGQSMVHNVPPPSQLWSGERISNKNNGILNDKGTHNTLLGSVGSIVGQINKATPQKGGNRVTNQNHDNAPSREFVQQMNELRRVFPNNHEWRRGDGRWSQRHAVRPAPMLDTHDFTEGEIRHLVPSLPSSIGARRDIQNFVDPRLNSDMMLHRNNWFPGSQNLMQRQRMRMVNNQLPRTQVRLPRRIEVQSMAVAQHLLRKYPLLRGRVFLSRQGHVRNKFRHVTHKYARRRNRSRV